MNDGTERKYPEDASIRLAAKEGSERYALNTPHESVMSVPAMSEKQAKELAADEYPGSSPSDFEIAETCEHGFALRASCIRCGRGWGDGDRSVDTGTDQPEGPE